MDTFEYGNAYYMAVLTDYHRWRPMNEDCLFMNIYVPGKKLIPVSSCEKLIVEHSEISLAYIGMCKNNCLNKSEEKML